MLLENKYNLKLDYKGYMIEAMSYRAVPSPLMGSKFTTGRSSYTELDFWQVGAITDFTHGMNQKYMVDPSMCLYAEGIDMSKPGEYKLERDLEDYTGPINSANITAHYRATSKLYLGDANGAIYSTTDGTTWVTEYAGADTNAITSFYEIDGKIFAASGTGNLVSDVFKTGSWDSVASGTQFPRYVDRSAWSKTDGTNDVTGAQKVAMSFQVEMSGTTFDDLDIYVKKVGTPPSSLVITIHEEDPDKRGTPFLTETLATFTYTAASIGTSFDWESASNAADFKLRASLKYFLVASTATGDASNCYQWCISDNANAYYEYGNSKTYDGTAWTDEPYQNQWFNLKRKTLTDLYFVMVESDYAFGWFNDGIRRSMDGYNWTPEPPDPLWVVPDGEGIVQNATNVPGGFIAGTKRGLWAFVGGSSGHAIWAIPDYQSVYNFRGMDKWGPYAIFSVENQGIYYTDGSQTFPTSLGYLEEGFVFKSCKCIYSSGWDIYACISDNGTDWYLARCNMNYTVQPRYWWIVKQLSKEPVHMAGYNDQKIIIFYSDNTEQYINKVSGKFLTSGYMETSVLDEGLVRLQKMYRNISAIYDSFPTDTSSALTYKLDSDSYATAETFAGDGTSLETTRQLANPTVGNRLTIKNTLTTTDQTKSPVVTDITWKYILQTPKEDSVVKRTFNFSIYGEDMLEKFDGSVEELDRENPRTRQEILDALWASAAKKEILNFVTPDNQSELAINIKYTGSNTEVKLKIDFTNFNFQITTTEGTDAHAYTYKNKTVTDVVNEINGWTNFTATLNADISATRTAHDLEPCLDFYIEEDSYISVGSDVTSVIMISSPAQQKIELDGRGSDSLFITVREA